MNQAHDETPANTARLSFREMVVSMKTLTLCLLFATILVGCSGEKESVVEQGGAQGSGSTPAPAPQLTPEPTISDSWKLERALETSFEAQAKLEQAQCFPKQCQSTSVEQLQEQIDLLTSLLGWAGRVEELAANGIHKQFQPKLLPQLEKLRKLVAQYGERKIEKMAELAATKETAVGAVAEAKKEIEILNHRAAADGCPVGVSGWARCELKAVSEQIVEDLFPLEKQILWGERYAAAYGKLVTALKASGLKQDHPELAKAWDIRLSAANFAQIFRNQFSSIADQAVNNERAVIARQTGVPGLRFKEIKSEKQSLDLSQHIVRAQATVKESKSMGARLERLADEIALRAIDRVLIGDGSHEPYAENAFAYHPDHEASLGVKISETQSEASVLAFLRNLELKSGKRWQARAKEIKRFEATLAIPVVEQAEGTIFPIEIRVSLDFRQSLRFNEKLSYGIEFLEGLAKARDVIDAEAKRQFNGRSGTPLQGNEMFTVCDSRSCERLPPNQHRYLAVVGRLGIIGVPSENNLQLLVFEYALSRKKDSPKPR